MLTATDNERRDYRNAWVVAEQRDGVITAVTFELLGAARRLMATAGGQVWCVVLGDGRGGTPPTAVRHEADTVLTVTDPVLAEFVDETYANVLSRLIRKYRPEIVLCGATAYGRSLMPCVAGQINAGLTADCTGLALEPETGNLLQTRPAFGGNIMATIKCPNHRPQMATVRPRVMSRGPATPGPGGTLVTEPLDPQDVSRRMRVLRTVLNDTKAVSLADAQFIIAGGRGVRGKAGFDLLKEFAAAVGGAVGASRAAVDAGWIDYAHQIGQTGQTVQPKVYIACGVSGQVLHLVGMQSAHRIIAINRDPTAPIMKLADYAVVGDLFEIIPAMLKELRRV